MVYNRIQQLLSRIPHLCLICSAGLSDQRLICNSCTTLLTSNTPACPVCAEPGVVSGVCGHCLREPPVVQQVIAPYIYQPPLSQLIQRFKFNDVPSLAGPLASLMQQAISKQLQRKPDLIIPVPLHRNRLFKRGFNQSHELARRLGRELKIPCTSNLLVKTHSTVEQSRLHKQQRITNLKSAFQVRNDVSGKYVVIVDDVYTTGATIDSIAGLLDKAGACRVDAWVIARTAQR